ncbi:MAG: primosomal protein N' [Prolixibacteraceae bacterium]|nr:primosomal protein N' [Prolixibacteraceae bacterium]
MPGLYVNVILPLSLQETYTYRIPGELEGKIVPGQRVVVQFGRKKFFSALVLSISDSPPPDIEIKDIIQILDDKPLLFPDNLKLWKWMAQYYCCTLGEIFRAAFPPGLILESKSKVILTGNKDECILTGEEYMITDLADEGIISLDMLQKKLGNKFSYKALNSLLEKGLIRIEEKIASKYKAKTSTWLKLNPEYGSEFRLNSLIESLGRSKKQQSLLIHYCEKTGLFDKGSRCCISKKELSGETGVSASVIKALIKKGIMIEFQKEESRLLRNNDEYQAGINLLSDNQSEAIKEIREGFDQKKVVLIHGITASGKTEIYIHLIDEVIRSGKQVLYLLPEIVLTTQIIQRLKNVFGNKTGVYHSRFSSHERVEIWREVLNFRKGVNEQYQIVLGTRSSLFLPFSKLGLIIVDEEHENSFKQFDPAPRYNARDMAVILGSQHNANVLMGSATPSYESYSNALSGKYKLVNLVKRYSNLELPEIIIADVSKAMKKKQMKGVLTPELFLLMKEAFENDQQVILFQNRRGYSPFIQCFECGWIPKCINCDVSLTYHKFDERLKCHYCGYSIPMPGKCHKCGSSEVKTRGTGTEKIEEELALLFPEIKIGRIDYDTTRTKNSFNDIIEDFGKGRINLLIGTQMVTKGLDFEHVSIVGIINADNLINYPDFRAHERAFQLISQVSGRAGRKHSRGKVVVQTSQPDHPLISYIRNQDFYSVYNMQMEERKLFSYPPYSRLIKITVKHKKPETVNRAARQLAALLKKRFPFIVLGPGFPLVGRIQLLYINEIWLKIKQERSVRQAKQIIMKSVADVKNSPENSNCTMVIDVDPA